MDKLCVVIMYRYGNLENHSYLLGVYDTIGIAILEGEKEYVYRGCGKYYPHVLEVELNATKKRRVIQSAESVHFS